MNTRQKADALRSELLGQRIKDRTTNKTIIVSKIRYQGASENVILIGILGETLTLSYKAAITLINGTNNRYKIIGENQL